MNQETSERPRSGIRNQQRSRVYAPLKQEVKFAELDGIKLSAKELRWVWECHWSHTLSTYTAYNRDTREEKLLNLPKEASDRAHSMVQAMNLAITGKDTNP